MLSWEYPPKISGGLGMACQGLSQALAAKGYAIDILLPRRSDLHKESENIRLISADDLAQSDEQWISPEAFTSQTAKLEFGTTFLPYLSSFYFERESRNYVRAKGEKFLEKQVLEEVELSGEYTSHIFTEIYKYALLAKAIAEKGDYSVVHAHDWVTFKAGQLIQSAMDIPVLYHIHSTEKDRNGLHRNEQVEEIEKQSLANGRYVLAVSEMLKGAIVDQYGISGNKIEVVPNGITAKQEKPSKVSHHRVGFVGRLTHQKGPDNFLNIVQDLRTIHPAVHFDIVGDGYLMPDLLKKVQQLNLAGKVTFHGFVPPHKVRELMKKFDVMIVPSNSEPFGLVILEALSYGVPVITSPNTGIAEFIPSLPQIENWDTYNFTQLIDRFITDEPFRNSTLLKCQKESSHLTWEKAAARVGELYEGLIQMP